MDFTLSLAHFCETHGPVSILCTQAAPIACSYCSPRSTSSSFGDFNTAAGDTTAAQKESEANDPVLLSASGSFDFADIHESLVKDEKADVTCWKDDQGAPGGGTLSTASRILSDGREERRKLYEAGCETKYCVSCSIFAPQTIAQSLPAGCPGSFLGAGTGRNGSPILRSEEPYQVWDDDLRSDSENEDDEEGGPSRQCRPSPNSFNSRSSSSCHTHTRNYISTSNPINPNIYSLFRKLVLRTLTGEELPRGLTSGKLAFDDAADRTTVAYKFRLSDPFARGGYRFYALIALAGGGNWGAFRAAARIWERFQVIADWLAVKVDEHLATVQPPSTSSSSSEKTDASSYLPVSSFLTGRDRPRARGLTEMTGDDHIFAALHLEFVSLRKELGRMYE